MEPEQAGYRFSRRPSQHAASPPPTYTSAKKSESPGNAWALSLMGPGWTRSTDLAPPASEIGDPVPGNSKEWRSCWLPPWKVGAAGARLRVSWAHFMCTPAPHTRRPVVRREDRGRNDFIRHTVQDATPQSPAAASRKSFTSSQCMNASNQRLLVRSGFPRPNPWPPF